MFKKIGSDESVTENMGDYAKGSRICKMQDTNPSHRVKLLSRAINTALISVLTLAMTFNTKKPLPLC